jgi:glycosyltransferase involved in cell wall biosynthesis
VSGGLLVVSLATTTGWRVNERELSASLARLGVHHRVVRLDLGPERHLRRAGLWPVTDAVEAVGSRRALRRGTREGRPSAVIFLSTTAALLAPLGSLRAGGIRTAVRVDVPSSSSRPGPQNAAQRALERRRLREADVVLATGPRSAALLSPLAERVAVVPVPVTAAGALPPDREDPRDVLTYAADPENKGLGLICEAWWALGEAMRGRRLHVTGVPADRGRRHLIRRGIAEPEGLVWHGELPHAEHLALLGEAAAYASASAWEGAGIAQLEALAAGVPLATTPSRGAYEAFPLARSLAPELTAPDRSVTAVAAALGAALGLSADERRDYSARAAASVHGFTREAADRALRDEAHPLLA